MGMAHAPRAVAIQPLSIGAIVLLALAVHGPLLMLELPLLSIHGSTHMFFAQHYAQHWFDPWNTKWFGGFSQTVHPPLAHQIVALLSKLMSVALAYMAAQLFAVR